MIDLNEDNKTPQLISDKKFFCKFAISLSMDGSDDKELSIRDLLEIVIGDWRFVKGQIDI